MTRIYRLTVTPAIRNWPRRNYLTKQGAERAAAVLRGYGSAVTIERSDPVTWPAADADRGAP